MLRHNHFEFQIFLEMNTTAASATTDGLSTETRDLTSTHVSSTQGAVSTPSPITTGDLNATPKTTPQGLLNEGQIAGIVVGALLGIVLCVVIVLLLLRYIKKKNKKQKSSLPTKEQLRETESASTQDLRYAQNVSMQSNPSNASDIGAGMVSSHRSREDVDVHNVEITVPASVKPSSSKNNVVKKDYVNQQVIDALHKISEGVADESDFAVLEQIEDIYENTDVRGQLQESVVDFDASKKYQNEEIIRMLRRSNQDYQNKDVIRNMSRRPGQGQHDRRPNRAEKKSNTEQETYENMNFSVNER